MTDRCPFMVRSSARMSLTFADPCSELEGMVWAMGGREGAGVLWVPGRESHPGG